MSLARQGQRGSSRRRGKKPGRLGSLGRAGMRALGQAGGGRMRGRSARRKGITSTELKGFNRVSRLLAKFGMVPRKMRGARIARSKR